MNALYNENQDVAAGRITATDREMIGKTAGKFQSLDDIRGILLTTPGGARVPMSRGRRRSRHERAAAKLGSTRRRSRGSHLRSVNSPRRTRSKSRTAFARGSRSCRHSSFVPKDVRYVVTYDQSGFIRDSLNSVKEAALVGAFLAALVVLLFLRSLRKTLIVGLSIPLAVLATFIAMGLGNLTLNVMSLGGIALGMGVLLDNAIVMLENIYRRRAKDGLDAEEGAHVGAGRGDEPDRRGHGDEPRVGRAVPADHGTLGARVPRADSHRLDLASRLTARRAHARADARGAARKDSLHAVGSSISGRCSRSTAASIA